MEGLIQLAKQGDKDALIKIIMNYKDDYYRLALAYLGNEDDALDAIEDMIVILYEQIHRLRDNNAFFSWSKTILINCCRNIYRKKKKYIFVGQIIDTHESLAADTTDFSLDLRHQLNKLKPKHREVIILRYLLDYEYKTIAKVLEIPEGTVKSRISNGLKRLKKLLGGDYFG